jgi:hypothetical protein
MATSIQPTELQNHVQPTRLQGQAGKAAHAAKAEQSEDSFKPQRHSPQQLLNQQIMQAIGKLNEHLGAQGFAAIETLDPAEYTPEKVADRILNFIDLAVKQAEAKGASEGELDKLRAQARAGVEDGYRKAYEMLNGLGILKGEVKSGVEKTWTLLQQGLDRMDRGEALVLDKAQEQAAISQSLTASQESRSLSLQVQTKEGDSINIQLNRSSSQASISQQDDGHGFAVQLESRSSSFSFEYQVQGDLNEHEQAALTKLLSGIDSLANDFFAGKGPESLDTFIKGGFDASQLSGFNLNLQQTKTQVAAQAYRQVDRLGQAPASTESSLASSLQSLSDWVKELQELQKEATADLGQRLGIPFTHLRELLAQRFDLEPGQDGKGAQQANQLMDLMAANEPRQVVE